MERVHMKLQVLKGEILAELNELFRIKVQLEEQQKDNEVKLQFNRGRMQAFDEVQIILKEMKKADELEVRKTEIAELAKRTAAAALSDQPSDDGDKEKTKVPEVKA